MAEKYGIDSIQEQTELEAVRMYPNVYLGSDDVWGATQTIREILANSVDEANSGFGNKINITIHKDNSITIKDRGRGVPMDLNKKTGKYAYESVFCKLHAGGKLKGSRNNYNSSAGQHGIGAAATNMSSAWFKAESKRDGYIYKISFTEGKPDGKLEKVKDSTNPQKTGTTISWKPDEKVFTSIDFDLEELKYWVKSQAICSDNVEFILKDERNDFSETYKYENGILSYAKEILGENEHLSELTLFEEKGSGKDKADRPNYTVDAKVAFAFTNNTNHYSFYHNSIPLPTGGAPKRAMQRAFSEYFKSELKKTNANAAKEIEFEDVAESLVCIISTTTKEPPSFENQTKKSISNKFIEDFLTLQITKHLKDWAKENPMELEKVTNQVAINIQSRKSASAQKLATKQKLTSKLKIDDKIKNFVDCRSKDSNERELHICLKGDTKIKLLDGTSPTIESIAGQTNLWGYSTDEIGRMIPAKIKEVFKTQEVNTTIKLTFEDGSTVECTPEHLFLDKDTLAWVKAKDLYIGQSMSSMKFKVSDTKFSTGRPMVWVPEQYEKYNSKTKKVQGHWELVHQRVASLLGISREFDGTNYMNVHHIDGNVFNNSPENLEFITPSEHRTKHNIEWHESGKQKEQFYNMSDESWEKMRNGYKNWSEEGKERIRQGTINSWKNNTNPERTWTHYNNSPKHKEDSIKNKKIRQIKVGKSILNDNLEISEETWKKYRKYNLNGNLSNVIKNFGSLEQFIEEVKNYNLKITNIEYVYYDTPISVYCLNIDSDFHSFVLDNGIITHNCEGLSAMGSLKQARNSDNQALLAIRGKILNTLKTDYNTIFKNELVMDIMKLVGTGVEMKAGKNNKLSNFEYDNLRFNKIIICTDQDVDGLHIISLCLTLFYRLTPELIKKGHIYFLDTPLYEIQISEGKNKGKTLYAFTDKEMLDLTKDVKCKVSRNKGLGEVNQDVMEVFLHPDTRHLTRVTIEDAKKAEEAFELFMGSDSSDRKKYITEHGKEYTDLDLE